MAVSQARQSYAGEEGAAGPKCKTVDLEVPSHSEVVLEGHDHPGRGAARMVPFGDHNGLLRPVVEASTFGCAFSASPGA